jgi:zinc protease
MPTYLASTEEHHSMGVSLVKHLLWIGAALAVAFPLAALEPGPTRSSASASASAPAFASASVAASASASFSGPRLRFSDQRLANGLRVLIAEDHTAPVFSIAVVYDVGSANERPGRTGFAHLFEHMMFKGSANVGSGEHFVLIYNNGGSMNGTTNKDRTNYYETLPANQLDLALFLEADRMRALDITQANLDNQRNAVQEERRLRLDNQPYGRTGELFDQFAYEHFAYKHSTIGSMEDLNAATVDDVAAFFKTYYAPNNAALAIVGDVDTQKTLARLRHHFEAIPRQPAPAAIDRLEPPQTAERRTTIDDALARVPRVDIGYHVPPANTKDHDALDVLSTILASGRSSRFYESIIRQQQLASGAGAYVIDSRGPGLFRASGTALPGKNIADIEAAIYDEIERVKTGTIEQWEIDKARNDARNGFLGQLTSSLGRAVILAENAIFWNNPNKINTEADEIAAVTIADVQRVAKQYLIPTNRTVVITMPKAGTPATAAQPTKGGE